jgi:hypothetical protein
LGGWGFGPTPQSPIPNPQSPSPIPIFKKILYKKYKIILSFIPIFKKFGNKNS